MNFTPERIVSTALAMTSPDATMPRYSRPRSSTPAKYVI